MFVLSNSSVGGEAPRCSFSVPRRARVFTLNLVSQVGLPISWMPTHLGTDGLLLDLGSLQLNLVYLLCYIVYLYLILLSVSF
jgi:hypothetical protein